MTDRPHGAVSDLAVGPTIPVFGMVVKYPFFACPLARDCVEWFIRRSNPGCHHDRRNPGSDHEPREE